MAAAPTLVQAAAAEVAPRGQCGGKGGGGEGGTPPAKARYEALAHVEHQRRRHQRPGQGPDTIYQLEMEPGRMGIRGGQAEQSSAAVQVSGAEQVQASRGKQGKGAGQKGYRGRDRGRRDSTE